MPISAIVSFGHAEYVLHGDGVKVEDIWSPYDELPDGAVDDDEARAAFEKVTGLPASNAGDADLTFEHVCVVTGERDDLIAALDQLITDLRESPGADDGTFDYWPSGMRLALQLDEVLDAGRHDEIEAVARYVILELEDGERQPYAGELFDKIGLPPIPIPDIPGAAFFRCTDGDSRRASAQATFQAILQDGHAWDVSIEFTVPYRGDYDLTVHVTGPSVLDCLRRYGTDALVTAEPYDDTVTAVYRAWSGTDPDEAVRQTNELLTWIEETL